MNSNANIRRETVIQRDVATHGRQHVTLTKIIMFVVLAALIVGGIVWYRNRDRSSTVDVRETRPGAARVIDNGVAPTPARDLDAPGATRAVPSDTAPGAVPAP